VVKEFASLYHKGGHGESPEDHPPSSQHSKTAIPRSQTSGQTASTLQNAHPVQWRVAAGPTPLPPKARKRTYCAAERAARALAPSKTFTLCNGESPPDQPPFLPKLETVHPMQPNVRGPPRTTPRDPKEPSETFTVCSQTSGYPQGRPKGPQGTPQDPKGASKGPPRGPTKCPPCGAKRAGPPRTTPNDPKEPRMTQKDTPRDPQGTPRNAHPVEPNERVPPRTTPKDPKEFPRPPRTFRGAPTGPHKTLTVCSQTSGDPRGPPQGTPRNPV
jgi:hypothetical protein